MSEREGGESRSVGAFLLGFLLGVLVTLGGGGAFYVIEQRRLGAFARTAMMEAEAARAEAERAREMAEKARLTEERARKAEQAARRGSEKAKDKGESKENVAAAGVRTLDKAVRAHKVIHGEYPESLADLTKPNDGKPALLEERALTDPWGRPYVYDPTRTNPNTGVPLIYSRGPDPKDEKGLIPNW